MNKQQKRAAKKREYRESLQKFTHPEEDRLYCMIYFKQNPLEHVNVPKREERPKRKRIRFSGEEW